VADAVLGPATVVVVVDVVDDVVEVVVVDELVWATANSDGPLANTTMAETTAPRDSQWDMRCVELTGIPSPKRAGDRKPIAQRVGKIRTPFTLTQTVVQLDSGPNGQDA
jgi:hypothetical protein